MRPFTTSPLPPARLPYLLAQPLLPSLPRPELLLPLPQIQGLLEPPQQLRRFLRSPLLTLRLLRLVPQSRQQLRCRLRRSGSLPDRSCPPSFRRCQESPSTVPASFLRVSR